MGEVVNLRQARKERARAAADAKAAANRARFGRTKAEKQADRADADRARKAVDGAELE